MKFLKKGFTLAEVLLCLAIIGVVSALGMTATKQTAEMAYRGYYYTGFINLYNAVADFEDKRFFNDEDPDIGRLLPTIHNIATFATQLGEFFNVVPNGTSVTAKNGIVYDIRFSDEEETAHPNYYYITMRVPQAKSRQYRDGTDTVALVYSRNYDTGDHSLVPIRPDTTNNIQALSGLVGQTDLQIRRDLLPAYADNGLVGRPIVQQGSNEQKQYRNFREAFCRVKGRLNVAGVAVVNCSAQNVPGEPLKSVPAVPEGADSQAVLRFEKPSKAK